MQIKQVHLTYQLKQVMKFKKDAIKILYNHQQQQTILIKAGKQVIEYDYGNLIELGRIELKLKESKLGINVTYCDKYEIYFILYEGLQLYILQKKMILLNTIKFDSKYTVGLHYFNGHLLLLGLEEIDLLKFEFVIKKKSFNVIETNNYKKTNGQNIDKTQKKSELYEEDKYKQQQYDKNKKKKSEPIVIQDEECKYLAKDNFDMAHITKTSVCTNKEWNLGFYINDDYLFIWGSKDLTIMKQTIIEKLQKDWDFSQQYGFSSWFARAKQQIDGNTDNKNIQKTVTFQLVQKYHDITKHENLITKLLHFLEYRYFVIGFETGQLKLWKINTAVKKSELLVHSYEGHSKQIDSLQRSKNSKMFWSAGQDFQIKLWDIQQFTNVYTVNIVGIYTDLQLLTRSRFLLKKEGVRMDDDKQRDSCELFIGYLNNNLKIYRNINTKIISYYKYNDSVLLGLDNTPGLLVSENKDPIIMYPPPKSMEVRQITTNGINYYMLLEGGTLFITTNNSTIQSMESEEILDFDGYHMVQSIISVYIPKKIQLPCYDADFGQYRDVQCSNQILFGMSKGSVISVNKNDPKQIFARMSYHREKVINIAEIGNTLFTYCAEGQLKLIQISEKSIKCLRSLNSNSQIAFFQTIKNKAIFFTYKGPFQIFKYKNEQLTLFSDDKGNDHEKQVHSLDFISKTNSYVTASNDGKIKIWTSRKVLLLQLIMEFDLQGAWILESSFLIAHAGKLSLVSLEDCKFSQVDFNQKKYHDKSIVKFEEYYFSIKNQQKQPKQELEHKEVIIEELQNKPQIKHKQKVSVSYIGGKINYENEKPVFIYKGKLEDLDASIDESSQLIQSYQLNQTNQTKEQISTTIRQQPPKEYLHDWEGLVEYEKNRLNRFQPVRALPKILIHSVDRKQPSRQRIMSRRDLTLQRIIFQSILPQPS